MSAERVIKFRAWRNQQMSKPFTLGEGVCWPNGSVSTAVKLNVMQFTGLHDKNGKEIYEGDIILIDECKHKKVVEWCFESCCFVLRHLLSQPYSENFFMDEFTGLVIGNIYDNPELLEQQQ